MLTFSEIESLLTAFLPKSSRRREWWANETSDATTHVQRRTWIRHSLSVAWMIVHSLVCRTLLRAELWQSTASRQAEIDDVAQTPDVILQPPNPKIGDTVIASDDLWPRPPRVLWRREVFDFAIARYDQGSVLSPAKRHLSPLQELGRLVTNHQIRTDP